MMRKLLTKREKTKEKIITPLLGVLIFYSTAPFRCRRFVCHKFGTFAFAPSHNANASAKSKEPNYQRFIVLLRTHSLYRKYFNEPKSYL
jgi:hypothetical protein